MMCTAQFTEGGFHTNVHEFLFPVKAKKGKKGEATQEM
jgi:hypothetical protein